MAYERRRLILHLFSMQHFPLYRPSDELCTGVDGTPQEEKYIRHGERKEVISREATETVNALLSLFSNQYQYVLVMTMSCSLYISFWEKYVNILKENQSIQFHVHQMKNSCMFMNRCKKLRNCRIYL